MMKIDIFTRLKISASFSPCVNCVLMNFKSSSRPTLTTPNLKILMCPEAASGGGGKGGSCPPPELILGGANGQKCPPQNLTGQILNQAVILILFLYKPAFSFNKNFLRQIEIKYFSLHFFLLYSQYFWFFTIQANPKLQPNPD